ncbi:hypothetical protein [Gottfriedia luciferensis]|uniref:hypothetical protein n=1 Tax=Gottfriedia luciferensis TaxID=178774 RepID=UPI000B42F7DC|nr:hypothetical protein [Gottfriedia luciferensis]
MKSLFFQKKILLIFKLITFGFALRDILLASLKSGLILKYGVEAFDKALLIRQILNLSMTGVSMLGFVYISKLLDSNQLNQSNYISSK